MSITLWLSLFVSLVQAQSEWLHTDALEPRGVFIVAHGLNTKPEKMNSLGIYLNSLGYDVYRWALPGHYGDLSEMKTVTKEKWLTSAKADYQKAEKRAQALKRPLYYLGFSMGALIGETLIAGHQDLTPPEKIIYFAPALGIRGRSRLVTTLGIFGSEFIVDSHSEQGYKAQRGVSIAGYRALFEMEDEIISHPDTTRASIPTLIYINPEDQLISLDRLKEYIANKKWSQVDLNLITDQAPEIDRTFSHLIIDQASLGQAVWTKVKSQISAFLTHNE